MTGSKRHRISSSITTIRKPDQLDIWMSAWWGQPISEARPRLCPTCGLPYEGMLTVTEDGSWCARCEAGGEAELHS